MQAGPILVISSLIHRHTQTDTHTQTLTPWPPADSVWTPGLDLEAYGIPEGWDLNSPD